jgi:hypothetical protein
MARSSEQFWQAFLVLVVAAGLYWVAKPYLPESLIPEDTEVSEGIVVDSLLQEALSNHPEVIATDSAKLPLASNEKTKPQLPDLKSLDGIRLVKFADFDLNFFPKPDSTALPQPVNLVGYDGMQNLNAFFKKLSELEESGEGKLRIAYYGDSMIEADLIVQKFREELQERFGGRGVGIVPIIDPSAKARYSIKHTYDGWIDYTFMTGDKAPHAYGLNGAVYYLKDSIATLKFNRGGIKHSYRLYRPTLLYGEHIDSTHMTVISENDTLLTTRLPETTEGLNQIVLSEKNLKSIDLNFVNYSLDSLRTPFFALNSDDGKGIHVDNFAMRGNSGLPLSLLSRKQMNQWHQEFDYDLIILQFGANVLSTKAKSFNWYASRMSKVVAHLQQCFPGAAILILGTGDKSTKIEDRMQSDSTVVRLLHAQQKYAAQTSSGFMSLMHVMGGINSMPAWVDHSPSMAVSDYTHFSPRGAQVMGKRIFNELMRYYESYRANNPAQEIEATEVAIDSISADSSQQNDN